MRPRMSNGVQHQKQRSYGFGLPDDHWSTRAACAAPGSDPDMWFSGHSSVENWLKVAQAIHICNTHCPVRQQCARDVDHLNGAVVAGVFFNEKGEPSDRQPVMAECGRCVHG